MNWKEFVKPTKWTILIFILLVILAFYSAGSVKISVLCDCIIGQQCICPQPFPYGNPFFQGIYYAFFFADYSQSPWIGTANGPAYNVMYLFLLVLNILYMYVISCLLVFIINKAKPRKK